MVVLNHKLGKDYGNFFREYNFIERILNKNGLELEFANDHVKSDRYLVATAIKNNGQAFVFASEKLRNDIELGELAIDSLFNDKMQLINFPSGGNFISYFGIDIVKNRNLIFKYLNKLNAFYNLNIQNNFKHYLKWTNSNFSIREIFNLLPDVLSLDTEILSWFISNVSPTYYSNIDQSSSLLFNEHILIALAKHPTEFFDYVINRNISTENVEVKLSISRIKDNQSIMKVYLKNGGSYEHVSDRIKRDKALYLELLSLNKKLSYDYKFLDISIKEDYHIMIETAKANPHDPLINIIRDEKVLDYLITNVNGLFFFRSEIYQKDLTWSQLDDKWYEKSPYAIKMLNFFGIKIAKNESYPLSQFIDIVIQISPFYSLDFLPNSVTQNKSFIRNYLTNNKFYPFKLLDETLLNDENFIFDIFENFPKTLIYENLVLLPDQLKRNKKILYLSVTNDIQNLRAFNHYLIIDNEDFFKKIIVGISASHDLELFIEFFPNYVFSLTEIKFLVNQMNSVDLKFLLKHINSLSSNHKEIALETLLEKGIPPIYSFPKNILKKKELVLRCLEKTYNFIFEIDSRSHGEYLNKETIDHFFNLYGDDDDVLNVLLKIDVNFIKFFSKRIQLKNAISALSENPMLIKFLDIDFNDLNKFKGFLQIYYRNLDDYPMTSKEELRKDEKSYTKTQKIKHILKEKFSNQNISRLLENELDKLKRSFVVERKENTQFSSLWFQIINHKIKDNLNLSLEVALIYEIYSDGRNFGDLFSSLDESQKLSFFNKILLQNQPNVNGKIVSIFASKISDEFAFKAIKKEPLLFLLASEEIQKLPKIKAFIEKNQRDVIKLQSLLTGF
jgi:hypothetical protein